jgi:transmembrane sensor
MPDQLSSTSVEVMEAFRKGSEEALVWIYRREYDGLVAEAGTALGHDLAHHSGRVAHSAMLIVWNRHEDVASLDGLRDMLSEAIRDEASVQRRKHAALHHGVSASSSRPHVAVPDAEAAVRALLDALHSGPVDHDQALREAAALRKQHAAEHVQQASKGRGWVVPTVLVVVLGVGILGLMQWVNRNSVAYAATKALEADNARTVAAARGQRGNITLNDGSKARIGSESRLKSPADFGGLVRTLELHGAASFDVASGNSLPFVVRAGHAVVTAQGTRLTIRAFDDDSEVFVAIDDGAATVTGADGASETPLAAGQAVRIAKDGRVQTLDAAQRAVVLAWLSDSLVFVDTPIRAVLPELRRWFDLDASLADPALGEPKISLRVGLLSSGDALNALATAGGLTIGFDQDKKVVLRAVSSGTVPARR